MAQRTAKQRRADNSRQAKLAELRAAEKRRRARVVGSLSIIGLVIVIVAIMVGVKLAGSANNANVASGPSGKVVSLVSSVPASTFDKVGAGTANAWPKAIKGGQPISDNGKPKVLYVGAEYCPYCAAERWAVVAALARFGTWHNVGLTASTGNDYAPNTPTLSFHGASYSSDYLAFAGYETQDRDGQPLDTLPASDEKLLKKYDAPPYVTGSAGSIPFIYYGGKYVSSGASYDPLMFKGMSHQQVARAMQDPNSDVAKAVDGSANAITAAVCRLTGNKPGNVCTAPGVQAAAKKLQPAS
ncbi:MAG TPA: DUF929 family protein [Marmoricola sp.]